MATKSATQLAFFSSDTTSTSDRDTLPYLQELGVTLLETSQRVQFNHNGSAPIHRWSPYVQGFSAEFVRDILYRYWDTYHFDQNDEAVAYDPFAGVGTVLVEAKRLGVRASMGTELNPLLSFLANTKLGSYDLSPELIQKTWNELDRSCWWPAPSFLESDRHFQPQVLQNLQILRGGLENICHEDIRDLFKMAFVAILIDCSNLKRTPSLGYWHGKTIVPMTPWILMERKLCQILEDLALIQQEHLDGQQQARVETADATEFSPPPLSLIITSPPYMNGLDYVINYKIEMAWLGFIESHPDAKKIKDRMVACDNISRRVTMEFEGRSDVYHDPWLVDILERISQNLEHWDEGFAQRRIPRRRKSPRGADDGPRRYRRRDMPLIVHKYFDDMYKVMKKLTQSLRPGGRMILVLGDSLIADVYVPTDLLITKMGIGLGLDIESVVKVRNRRSGQIRSYKLRESVVTLRKNC